MTMIKSLLLTASSAGLLFLGACSGGSPTATAPASQSTPSSTSQPIASPTTTTATSKQGGMVVESGPYHLELIPVKEGSNTHLDLLVQKGDNHEAIPNAKVTAQVQLPDGSQQSINMVYDAPEKHYAGKVASVAAGEYKVTAQAEIAGEKVNARFNFKQ